jgi:hypothetical protein
MTSGPPPESIESRWMREWPRALEAWSSYTQLRPPEFIDDRRQAARESMSGEIAAIRLQDQRIMINLESIRKRGLENFPTAIMAHEIGHHIYVPGNLTDNARMTAAIGRMLTGLPQSSAGLVGNLYGDLLINDRLQRKAGVDVSAVYRKLCENAGKVTEVWKIYMRTYEQLWSLPAGTLQPGKVSAELDADAMLLSRLIRNFAGDWLRGARRFAAVIYPYLAKDEADKRQQTLAELGLNDTKGAAIPRDGQDPTGAIPDGLTGIDPSEMGDTSDFDDDILDPLGEGDEKPKPADDQSPSREAKSPSEQQRRTPFEYGELLKALGLKLEARDVTIRYYRERALPYLIPFPTRKAPQVTEPIAEGYADWGIGDALEDMDPMASVMRSPVVIPGVTTVQTVYGEAPGSEPKRAPFNLDIYVDSSGSMPNPSLDVSYLALAGTILALSALRAGAAVQATLWSGPKQFQTTNGFIREENKILGIITGFIGGSTAFPLHLLRDTYDAKASLKKATHILVISDNGADTMLQKDERGEAGAAICKRALERAAGGGSLVLNIAPSWPWPAQSALEGIGYVVYRVPQLPDLVQFARDFVRRVYGANN